MRDKIRHLIRESQEVKDRMLKDDSVIQTIDQIVVAICNAIRANNKILLCGNGGSAADAQHIAAELAGRFQRDRDPIPAIALHTNTSFLTAVANDYSYDVIFERALNGLGKSGDVLMGISTSGRSNNVLKALHSAREKHIVTIGLTGKDAGEMSPLCDYLIRVPSNDTPRIQEAHILIGHVICCLVEDELFPARKNG